MMSLMSQSSKTHYSQQEISNNPIFDMPFICPLMSQFFSMNCILQLHFIIYSLVARSIPTYRRTLPDFLASKPRALISRPKILLEIECSLFSTHQSWYVLNNEVAETTAFGSPTLQQSSKNAPIRSCSPLQSRLALTKFSCCKFFRDGIPEFFAVRSRALGFHRIIYSKKFFYKSLNIC